jgi:hypothetical protein
MFISCDAQAKPDAKTGKHRRHQSAINLNRMLYHQPAVLNQLEPGDENSTHESVQENGFTHAAF